jgi:Photosynthesis system II assembly factor YCF48
MVSREQNEAVTGLLRQSLARDAGPGTACPDPEILAAYFEHSLASDETAQCELHLSRCGRCREQLGAMARAEQLADERVPELEPKHAGLLDWRWLTATAAVMALATVWLVHKPERRTLSSQPANRPLVAMDKTALPKPDSGTTGKDAAAPQSKPNPSEREDALQGAPLSKSAAAAKKLPSLPPMSEAVTVLSPQAPQEAARSQAADSTMARDEMASSAGGQQDLKQSRTAARSARAAGHAVGQQQNQASQPVTVTGQAVEPQNQGGPPAPAASPLGARAGIGGLAGGVAQSKTLDHESANQRAEKSLPISGSDLAAESGALQLLEERSTEKIINTPIPTVKWRINSGSFVERSDDGGATWKGEEVDPSGTLLAGSAPHDKICWVVGRHGLVLLTKDAQNWKKVPPPDSADLIAVSAKDASSATVTTADGRKFSTHNRGKKWKLENKTQESNPH